MGYATVIVRDELDGHFEGHAVHPNELGRSRFPCILGLSHFCAPRCDGVLGISRCNREK